ncbi:hypothetical protein AAMO2058_001636900 [Amorphochlora amoebiformis]
MRFARLGRLGVALLALTMAQNQEDQTHDQGGKARRWGCPLKAANANRAAALRKADQLVGKGELTVASVCLAIALELEGDEHDLEQAKEGLIVVKEILFLKQVSLPPYTYNPGGVREKAQGGSREDARVARRKDLPTAYPSLDLSHFSRLSHLSHLAQLLQSTPDVIVGNLSVRIVWRDLVMMMESYNITTAAEMTNLATPFDMLMLYGQLICQKDEASKALDSLTIALRAKATPEGLLLMGRIALGQGRFRTSFSYLLTAYNHLVLSNDQTLQSPRAHAQDLRSTLLFSLQFVAAQLSPRPRIEPEIRRRVCGLLNEVYAQTKNPTALCSESLVDSLALTPIRTRTPPTTSTTPTTPTASTTSTKPTTHTSTKATTSTTSSTSNPIQTPTHNPTHTPTPPQTEKDVFCSWDCLTWVSDSGLRDSFTTNGYVVIKSFLPDHVFQALKQTHRTLFHDHTGVATYVPSQRRSTVTNEQLSVYVNIRLAPLITRFLHGSRSINRCSFMDVDEANAHEDTHNPPILPTYAFSILYHEGGHIKPHTDRPQNQVRTVSCRTVTVREQSYHTWPFLRILHHRKFPIQ